MQGNAENGTVKVVAGGKLTVETANVTLDERYMGNGVVCAERYAMIAVNDTMEKADEKLSVVK